MEGDRQQRGTTTSKLNRHSAALIRKGEVSSAISLITECGKGGVLELTPEEYTSCTEDKAPSETHKPRCTAIYTRESTWIAVGCGSVCAQVLNPLQTTSGSGLSSIHFNPQFIKASILWMAWLQHTVWVTKKFPFFETRYRATVILRSVFVSVPFYNCPCFYCCVSI